MIKKGKNRKKRITRTINCIISCVLTAVMVAAAASAGEPAYAASGTQSVSVFNGSSYTHNARYDGKLIVNGVDASYWQAKSSNWTKAKAKGVDFAILRVTFSYYGPKTLSLDTDTKFVTHYNGAKAAGIMRGIYVFSQAKNATEARKEANYAIDRLRELGIGPEDLALPVYMDYEFAGPSSGSGKGRLYGISKKTATASAVAFCNTIREAGYQPGIYANTSFFNSYIDTSKLGSDVDLWCAQYYYKNTSDVRYSKWQYSSTANIDGIISTSTGKTGWTDVNFWYVDKQSTMSGVTDIYGVTEFNYTGKAVTPSFEVYAGSKLLTAGKDYIVGGISNVKKGTNTAYALIKGVGSYSGQTLIPFTIGDGYIASLGLGNCKASDGTFIIDNAHKYVDVTKYLITFTNADGQPLSAEYYEKGTPAADINIPEAPEKAEDEEFTYEFSGWKTADGQDVSDVTGAVIYVPQYTAVAKTPEEGGPEDPDQTEPPAENQTEASGQDQSGAVGQDQADSPAEDQSETPDQSQQETPEAPGEVQNTEPETDTGEEAGAEQDALPESVTESVRTDETVYDLRIGEKDIRNIPADLTVSQFLAGIEVKEDHRDSCRLSVINRKGSAQSGNAALRTGMLLGIYDKAGKRIDTADLYVNGDKIYDGRANYACPASSGKPSVSVKTVTVPKTSIKKLKRSRKSFTVKVAKKAKSAVTGYQVRYSRKANMSGAKIRTISSKYSKVTKKITRLKAKKRYYVQVRSYKVVNGKTYYSAWSAKKSVKTR